MLLRDEATTALDVATERAMSGALGEAARGRTTVSIAHRLSTIRHADQILVMEAGRIVARGTHDELLETSETYREIAASQAEVDA